MNRAHLTMAAIAGAVLLALSAAIGGPSDIEAEQAAKADLQDAITQAGRMDYDLIEPTPAYILHRYADLAGSKQ